MKYYTIAVIKGKSVGDGRESGEGGREISEPVMELYHKKQIKNTERQYCSAFLCQLVTAL